MRKAMSRHTPSRRELLAGTASLLTGAAITQSAVAGATLGDAALLGFCAEYHRALAALKEFYATAPEPSWESMAAHDAWEEASGRLHTSQSTAYRQACETPARTLTGIFAKAGVLASEADLGRDKEGPYQLLQDLLSLEGRA